MQRQDFHVSLKVLEFLSLNSRTWKYLKTGLVLKSRLIWVSRSLKELEKSPWISFCDYSGNLEEGLPSGTTHYHYHQQKFRILCVKVRWDVLRWILLKICLSVCLSVCVCIYVTDTKERGVVLWTSTQWNHSGWSTDPGTCTHHTIQLDQTPGLSLMMISLSVCLTFLYL